MLERNWRVENRDGQREEILFRKKRFIWNDRTFHE